MNTLLLMHPLSGWMILIARISLTAIKLYRQESHALTQNFVFKQIWTKTKINHHQIHIISLIWITPNEKLTQSFNLNQPTAQANRQWQKATSYICLECGQNTGYNCLAKFFNHNTKNSEDTSMNKADAVKAPQQYKPYVSLQHLIPPHKIYRRP
jgi:hypothetical protein